MNIYVLFQALRMGGGGSVPAVPPNRSGFQYTLPRNVAQHTLPPQRQFRLSRQ